MKLRCDVCDHVHEDAILNEPCVNSKSIDGWHCCSGHYRLVSDYRPVKIDELIPIASPDVPFVYSDPAPKREDEPRKCGKCGGPEYPHCPTCYPDDPEWVCEIPKLWCTVCGRRNGAIDRKAGLPCTRPSCTGSFQPMADTEPKREPQCPNCGNSSPRSTEEHCALCGYEPRDPLANYNPDDRHAACRANERRLMAELDAAKAMIVAERSPEWADQVIAFDLAKARADKAEAVLRNIRRQMEAVFIAAEESEARTWVSARAVALAIIDEINTVLEEKEDARTPIGRALSARTRKST
jgi:ribosomal protein L37E